MSLRLYTNLHYTNDGIVHILMVVTVSKKLHSLMRCIYKYIVRVTINQQLLITFDWTYSTEQIN